MYTCVKSFSLIIEKAALQAIILQTNFIPPHIESKSRHQIEFELPEIAPSMHSSFSEFDLHLYFIETDRITFSESDMHLHNHVLNNDVLNKNKFFYSEANFLFWKTYLLQTHPINSPNF